MTEQVPTVILNGMAKVKMTVWGWRCERCQHQWLPRQQGNPEPRTCPSCKSPYWNTPRKATMKPKEGAKK